MPGKHIPATKIGAASQIRSRVFKTRKFAMDATARGIRDAELCHAIEQVQSSPKTYSLGGEVYKKRLNNNMDRSIILARGGMHWFYAHLFRKSDRDNIRSDELAALRKLAKSLGAMSNGQLSERMKAGAFLEICHDYSREKDA